GCLGEVGGGGRGGRRGGGWAGGGSPPPRPLSNSRFAKRRLPMWWRTKTPIGPNGMQIHVKYDTLDLTDERQAQVESAVMDGRAMLDWALGALANFGHQSQAVRDAAGYYFKTHRWTG